MDQRNNLEGLIEELSAAPAGRNDLASRHALESEKSAETGRAAEPAQERDSTAAPLQQILSSYPNLQKLRRLVQADPQGRLLARTAANGAMTVAELQNPISISQLEMLEAELQNQGILPIRNDRSKLLSQFANYEVDLWRWRARRVGSDAVEMQFFVDTPRYVVHCAINLLRRYEQPQSASGAGIAEAASGVMAAATGLIEINHSWIAHISSDANLPSNLLYLERVATYVLGGYGRALNRFQRGLNVVLRALSSAPVPAGSISTIKLTMPFSRPEFFRALKSIRQR